MTVATSPALTWISFRPRIGKGTSADPAGVCTRSTWLESAGGAPGGEPGSSGISSTRIVVARRVPSRVMAAPHAWIRLSTAPPTRTET